VAAWTASLIGSATPCSVLSLGCSNQLAIWSRRTSGSIFTDLAKNGSCCRNRTPSLHLFDRFLRSSIRRLRAGRLVSLGAPVPRFLLCQKPVSDHLPNLRNPLRFPLGPPLLGADLLGAFHFEAVERHPVLLASVLTIL
jgi:hypothetical protein